MKELKYKIYIIELKNIFNRVKKIFEIDFCLILIFLCIILLLSISLIFREKLYVTEVIDGDTVVLLNKSKRESKTYRLLGINTPEIKHRGLKNEGYDECYGQEAKSFLKELIQNKTVYIEYDKQKKDKYNRELVYLYLDELNVNFELIRTGMANALLISPNFKYSSELKYLERKAKEDGKGIWGECIN